MDWPDLGCSVLYHSGNYDDLIGQLAFNFQIDTFKTVAIGIPIEIFNNISNPNIYLFGFVCHEAFHQFQNDSFADIPWAREELYPILERQNNALAYIEMRLLMDALRSAYAGQRNQTEDHLKQFVAVRKYRWENTDSFISKFEQGLEIREGTAQYVQVKSIDSFKNLQMDKLNNDFVLSLQKEFQNVSMPEYLLNDFQKRITHDAISPEDMPRNRIYSIGSALGLFLDYLNIDWKKKAQYDCANFSFADLLEGYFKIDKGQYAQLLSKAQKDYDFIKTLSTTDKLIKEYRSGYENELESFNSQSGYRIEFSFSYRSISRARSSLSKRWTSSQGKICLCNHYNVYSLKNMDLNFSLKNSGLYEETEWKAKKKRVVFYTDEISNIALDDFTFNLEEIVDQSFSQIQIDGKNFELSFSGVGKVSVSDNIIKIDLIL